MASGDYNYNSDNYDLRPSLGEYNGYFNVLPDDVGYSPVLRTSYDVPAYDGFWELGKVYRRAVKWFAKHVQPLVPKRPYDPICNEWFVPRFAGDDRTLYIDNYDATVLSARLLKRLQRTFLARHPFWRVLFFGEDAATAVMVYPDAIRVGSEPADVDIDAALKRLAPVQRELVNKRQRPMFEQLEYIKRHVADAIESIGERSFQVMGIINVGLYDFDDSTICVLAREVNYDDNITIDIPASSSCEISTTGPLNVNSQGAIVGEDRRPEASTFVVLRRFLPNTYQGPVTIADSETGQTETIEIMPETVIKWHETFAQTD